MAKRYRITIATSQELSDALESTRAATGRDTVSDVVRDSLDFYDLIVQKIREGKHIYIGDSRESAGEVLLPRLERARGHRLASEDDGS
ncbi:MAG: hypothetical protein QY323_05855 [Patescibacteria group bacterium]|nr:MAG: hypothetical protein QY323_05855 [Patescibacteria group bacterium]